MAVLTATIEEVLDTYNYARARVTVYVSGETTGGSCSVSIRAWDKSAVYAGTVTVAAQSDGTTQIYTGLHNLKRRYSTTGGCLCAVEASMSGATDLFVIQALSGNGVVQYGTDIEFGDTLYYAVSTGGTVSLTLNFVGEDGVQRDSTISNGYKAKGVYQYTIPESLMSYIPTKVQADGKRSPTSGPDMTSYRGAAQIYSIFNSNVYDATPLTIRVPEEYVPSMGDIQYKDAGGFGKPGDGVIDAFVQRLSSPVAWTTASATGGARISKVMCTYGTLSVTLGTSKGPAVTMPTESSPLSLGVVIETGDMELRLTVEDSRGRRATGSVTLKTAAYSLPTVTTSDVQRWDVAENAPDDESTTVRVRLAGSMSPVNGKPNTGSIKVYSAALGAEPDWQLESTTSVVTTSESGSGFDKSIDNEGFSETEEFRFRWELTDRFGQTVGGEAMIYGASPIMDFAPDGKSVGMWTTAGQREDDDGNAVGGLFVNSDVTIHEGFGLWGTGGKDEGLMRLAKLLGVGYNYATDSFVLDALQHVVLANGKHLEAKNAAGSITRLLGINESGQVEFNWTSGGLRGRVMKLLWSGTLSSGGRVTIADLPYYNVFGIVKSGAIGIGFKNAGKISGVTIHLTGNNTANHNMCLFRLGASGTTLSYEFGVLLSPTSNEYLSNQAIDGLYGIL